MYICTLNKIRPYAVTRQRFAYTVLLRFGFFFLYRIQCFCAGLKNANETGLFVSSINKREFGKVFAISYDPNCESFKLNSQ